MKEDRYTLFTNGRGFGLRIETAAGDTVEYPCISYETDLAHAFVKRMSGTQPDPVHYGDVVRDFITEQYLDQLRYNRLTEVCAVC